MVLLVDRARVGSAAIDWRFFEATRRALSARLLSTDAAERKIARQNQELVRKNYEIDDLRGRLDAALKEGRRLQQALSREQLNARRCWLRNRHGRVRWTRLAMIGITSVTLIIATILLASLLGDKQALDHSVENQPDNENALRDSDAGPETDPADLRQMPARGSR